MIFAKITIISLTIASILLISWSKETIEQNFVNDELLKNLFLQFKSQANIWIWFVLPLTTMILIIDIYKIYIFLYERREIRKNKKRNHSSKY